MKVRCSTYWANDPIYYKIKNKINKKVKNLKKKIKKCKKGEKIKNYKKIFFKYNEIIIKKKELKELKKILENKESEKEMLELVKEEIKKIKKEIKTKIKEIKNKLKKKKKEKVIMEIIMGVGGEESAIFISNLKKMYERYIEKMKWKKKIISENKTILGGYKELIILIKGINVYKNLKFESGVHRVQRSPKTENKGKVHTSTCRVAIYKKKKNKEIKIKESDLKIETFKSSGAGGQHVNKTNSAIRIKHLPTNIVVECQKERSQHKNKKYALNIIKNKILINKNKKKVENINKMKKKLFGEGERVEKIRTYNYKENRITDHRFKININNLNEIMEGKFYKIIKIIKKNVKKKKKNKWNIFFKNNFKTKKILKKIKENKKNILEIYSGNFYIINSLNKKKKIFKNLITDIINNKTKNQNLKKKLKIKYKNKIKNKIKNIKKIKNEIIILNKKNS
ncbi:MAG: PCRF domain-containing protein [Candidatus Nasuia deltocephalinicola]